MYAMIAPRRRDLQELGIDGEAEDVIAAHSFQQSQRGLAAIVAVTTYQDLDFGPVLADAADNVTKNFSHLFARGPLAGPKQREHRFARETVEDVDRLEAGAVVVRVEESELLLAMNGIVGFVDVEHDLPGWCLEAAAIQINLAEPDAGQRTPVGQVLEPRQRWLTHQVGTTVGRTTDGDLQCRIGAQGVDVVAVLVAGRDHEHARQRHLGVAVQDTSGITVVAQAGGDYLGQAET